MLLVSNVHEREYPVPAERLGALLDTLSSENDRLWPADWPPIRFDRPLAVGARGGHGPIRYSVIDYEPGRRLVCRFEPRLGGIGTHGFEVRDGPTTDTSALRHTIVMRTTDRMRLLWPLAIRWLHDELVEDLLDRAAVTVGGSPADRHRRPFRGRLIRVAMFVLAPAKSPGRERVTEAPVSP